MLTFAHVNFSIIVYGDVDIDAENGYRTYSLHLRFVQFLLLFSKMQTPTLTLSVNGPLSYKL